MDLDIRFEGHEKILAFLDLSQQHKILSSALTKIANKALTAGKREARQIFAIKARDLNRSVYIDKAYTSRLLVGIRILGPRISLRYFGAKRTKTGRVTVMVLRGKRATLRHAFMHAGQVFERKEMNGMRVGRLPIIKRAGPSVPAMFRNARVSQALHDSVKTESPVIFRRQMEWVLVSRGAKRR